MADAETGDAAILAPRTKPRQRRAIERRQAILDAAQSLLAEHTIDALTTSLIAARAGVPVASVTSGSSMIPPEPTRMVLVPPATCPITTAVAALAMPLML